MRRTAYIAGGGGVALLAAIVFFAYLGSYALWDPDEARHAEVAREVFTATEWSGWLVPSLNFRPYYDKPILFYWLVAGAYALGGVSELAARAVPAIAALVTVIAVYAWAARTWGLRAGIAAGTILITAGEFAVLARYANLDMLLTMWVTLGLFAVDRWTRRAAAGASLAPAAACAALGMLTKGLVAPVLTGGIGIAYLAVTRQLGLLAQTRIVRTVGTFIAVAGPWYLGVALLEPEYLREFFWRHHFERFFRDVRYLHPGPIYYYIPMLLGCFFPWSAFLPATVRGTLARGRRGRAELFCLCWAVGILTFFSLAKGKLGTYILPALPPLALLTGRYVSELVARSSLEGTERRLVAGGVWVTAAVCFLALPILLPLTWRIYDGAWMRTSLLAALLIPIGGILLLMLRQERHHLTPIAIGIGFCAALLVFYRWGAPEISAIRSEAPLAAAIAAGAPVGLAAPIVAYSVRTPSLLFYVRRPVREIDHPRSLERALERDPLVFVVTSRKHVPVVLATGRLFPWHTHARHKLYASKPPARSLSSPDGEPPTAR